jgi:hypothetical protein
MRCDINNPDRYYKPTPTTWPAGMWKVRPRLNNHVGGGFCRRRAVPRTLTSASKQEEPHSGAFAACHVRNL